MQQQYKDASNGIIEIRFPENGQLRSRKVVKRSNARNSGKYPSWKMKRMMQWESPHEGNAMRLLDATPNVISFHEQPCEIIYVLNGEKHSHFPDLMVKESMFCEFWEVKTERDANEPEVTERTKFLTEALPALGYGYRIALAEMLARQPRLDNVKRLNKLGRQAVPFIEKEKLRQLFTELSVLNWGIFEAQSHATLQHISRLILEGKLSIDLNQPIIAITKIHSQFNAEH